MTKKKNDLRYIKNRTWEKERRNRLNNTFDKLAKLLPEYQPKVTFSKIEILQKTIAYVEDLRLKIRELLTGQCPSILKSQEELEESLRALIIRNNELIALLQKSKLVVPPFIGPKLLSCIVTIHKDEDEIVPAKSSAEKPKLDNATKKRSEDSKKKSESKKSPSKKSENASVEPTKQTDAIEPTKIGGLELIPVYDGDSVKKNSEPVKNSVEIHPVISAKQIASTSSEVKSSVENHPKKPKKEKANDENKASVDSRNSKSKKRKTESDKNERGAKSQRKSKEVRKSIEIIKNSDEPDVIGKKQKAPEKQLKCDNVDKVKKCSDGKVKVLTNEQNGESSNRNVPKNPNANLRVEIDQSSIQEIRTPGPPELGSDVLANLNMVSNDLNPASLSPTAAFLQSFPVVSSTASKPTEIESNYTATNLLQITDKTNQQSEQSLFENITSLFGAENSPPAKVANECSAALLSGLEMSKNVNMTKGKDSKCDLQSLNNTEKSTSSSYKNKSTYKPPDFSFPFSFPPTSATTVPISTLSSSIAPISSISSSAHTVQCINPFDFYESLSSIGVPNSKNQANIKRSSNYAITSLTDSKTSSQIIPSIATTSTAPFAQNNNTTDFGMKIINPEPGTKKTPIKHSISERFIGNSSTTTSNSSFNPYPIENLPTPSLPMNFPFYHPPASSSASTNFNQSASSTFSVANNCVPFNNYSDATAHGHQQSQSYNNSHNFDFSPEKPPSTAAPKPQMANNKFNENEKKQLTPSKPIKQMVDKSSRSTAKSHVNWMTSPTSNYQKQMPTDTSGISAYSTTSLYNTSHYQTSHEDNLPWSPNRLIDASNFTPTAVLPNLNGDLALNTINVPFGTSSSCHTQKDTKITSTRNERTANNIAEKKPKSFDQQTQQSQAQSQSQYQPQNQSYSQIENNNISNNNFLSVSQLVEHQQRNQNTNPSLSEVKKCKTKEPSNPKSKNSKNIGNSNLFSSNCNLGNGLSTDTHKPQTYSNSYSAEALISSTSTNPVNTFNDNDNAKRIKPLNSYPQSTISSSNIDFFGNNGNTNGPDYGSTLSTDIYNPYYPSMQSQQAFDNDFFSSPMTYGCNPPNNNISMSQLSTYAPPQFQHYSQQDTQSDFSSRRNYSSNNFASAPVSSIKTSTQSRPIPAPSFVLPVFGESSSKANANHKSSLDSSRSQTNNSNQNDKMQPPLPLHLPTPNLSGNFSNNCSYRPPIFPTSNIDIACGSSALKPTHYPSTNSTINSCANQNYNGQEGNNYSGNTNTITNFNLTTICPEIGHDKRRQTQNW